MSKSTWLSDVQIPKALPPLSSDVTAEVVIIGGGLVAHITSYLLGKEGKKVVVLEQKDITNTTTAYTTAWLNWVIDTDLGDLVKMYGDHGTRKIWHSGMEAIDLIEKIIKDEGIECDFSRVPHYSYATSKDEAEDLKEEQEIAQKLGFKTEFKEKQYLPFKNEGSLELLAQAKFHPIKFMLGLRRAMDKFGVVMYENTEAKSLEGVSVVEVTTPRGKVKADYCIIATYDPFNSPRELFAHKGMYRSYVFEVDIPKSTIKEGLYEDQNNPYHYFRIDAGEKNDRMILGGEDHRNEIPYLEEKSFRALEEYLADLLPNTKYGIITKWHGRILETIDGLPYIGSYSKEFPNRLVATGFSGNGMTYSAISGQILTDLILHKENPYQSLYSASRKTRPYNSIKKGLDFIKEFFGGAGKNLFK